MMRIVMVNYTLKADRVEENERLVRAVYRELAQNAPEGLRYATLKLEDGRSFMHLAEVADEAENPLTRQPAFAEFQREIAERCETQPVVTTLDRIGSYRLLGEAAPA
jgi:hypothetical protein